MSKTINSPNDQRRAEGLRLRRRQSADPGQAIRETRRATISARSIAYPPPDAGRAQWMHVVPRCPYGCRTAHVHRAGPEGGHRRAGCGLGSYVVTPWAVREEKP